MRDYPPCVTETVALASLKETFVPSLHCAIRVSIPFLQNRGILEIYINKESAIW